MHIAPVVCIKPLGAEAVTATGSRCLLQLAAEACRGVPHPVLCDSHESADLV